MWCQLILAPLLNGKIKATYFDHRYYCYHLGDNQAPCEECTEHRRGTLKLSPCPFNQEMTFMYYHENHGRKSFWYECNLDGKTPRQEKKNGWNLVKSASLDWPLILLNWTFQKGNSSNEFYFSGGGEVLLQMHFTTVNDCEKNTVIATKWHTTAQRTGSGNQCEEPNACYGHL